MKVSNCAVPAHTMIHSVCPAKGRRDEPPWAGGGNCLDAIYRASRPSKAKPETGRRAIASPLNANVQCPSDWFLESLKVKRRAAT